MYLMNTWALDWSRDSRSAMTCSVRQSDLCYNTLLHIISYCYIDHYYILLRSLFYIVIPLLLHIITFTIIMYYYKIIITYYYIIITALLHCYYIMITWLLHHCYLLLLHYYYTIITNYYIGHGYHTWACTCVAAVCRQCGRGVARLQHGSTGAWAAWGRRGSGVKAAWGL